MTKDELIEIAKKIDDLTTDLTSEEYNRVVRIAQGLKPNQQRGVFQNKEASKTEV